MKFQLPYSVYLFHTFYCPLPLKRLSELFIQKTSIMKTFTLTIPGLGDFNVKPSGEENTFILTEDIGDRSYVINKDTDGNWFMKTSEGATTTETMLNQDTIGKLIEDRIG